MRGSRWLAVALSAGLVALASGGGAQARTDRLVFRIEPSEIDESSSLVVSETDPGLVYTANDSGGSATVYVLDGDTGDLVGSTSLAGIEPVDIEAMTPADKKSLIVADIGDNDDERAYTTVYRIDQPGRGTHAVSADSVQVTYATGPHNAEAAVYDVRTGRLFIVSKQTAGARVFRSPRDLFSHQQVVMKPVAPAPALATDAALLPGRDVAVVRTYFAAYFYAFPSWRPLGARELPPQQQGESVAVPAGGDQIWVGSEGVHSRVLAVPVPDLTRDRTPTSAPPASAGPSATSEADEKHRDQVKSRAVLVGGGALGRLHLVAVLKPVGWNRHPHVD
jgi:hypothetical protein